MQQHQFAVSFVPPRARDAQIAHAARAGAQRLQDLPCQVVVVAAHAAIARAATQFKRLETLGRPLTAAELAAAVRLCLVAESVGMCLRALRSDAERLRSSQ